MKKRLITVQFSLLLVFLFTVVINAFAQDDGKAETSNYLIARWVIGSGGIIGSSSANHFHRATAGQTLVGTMQGSNYWLISGFWLPRGQPTGIPAEEPVAIPIAFELDQNYPNPFNPQTTIQYSLPQACQVTIEIFNVMGQRIRMLRSGIQGPGIFQMIWDARDENGERVGSGIYLCSFTAHEMAEKGSNFSPMLYRDNRKLILIK